MRIKSGEVYFYMQSNSVVEVIAKPGIDRESVTRIEVPLTANYHVNSLIYHTFPNLLELVAHPLSSSYKTYDGALYSKTGNLLYVPLGKRTLHLAPFISNIDYHAFYLHERLEEIFLDSENTSFDVKHGCLMKKDESTVYFVINPERQLFIPANTIYITEDVLAQKLQSVLIAPGNEVFQLHDGILCRHDRIVYLLALECIRIPEVVTQMTTLEARKLFLHAKEVITCPEHSVFRVEENVLLNLEEKKVVYVSPLAKRLTVPNGFTLCEGCLAEAFSLTEISVSYDLSVSRKAYRLKSKCYIDSHKPLLITVRWPDGSSFTTTGEFSSVLNTIREQKVEIKSGKEILYLDLFLSGRLMQSHLKNFYSGVYQILLYLIDRNDLTRIKTLIVDNRLITRKNISRLIRYARQNQKSEVLEVLTDARNRPIPDSFPWMD